MHEEGFDRCIGIEILDNLFAKSLQLKEVYDRYAVKTVDIQPETSLLPRFEVY